MSVDRSGRVLASRSAADQWYGLRSSRKRGAPPREEPEGEFTMRRLWTMTIVSMALASSFQFYRTEMSGRIRAADLTVLQGAMGGQSGCQACFDQGNQCPNSGCTRTGPSSSSYVSGTGNHLWDCDVIATGGSTGCCATAGAGCNAPTAACQTSYTCTTSTCYTGTCTAKGSTIVVNGCVKSGKSC